MNDMNEIYDFLNNHPRMSLLPLNGGSLCLKGTYEFQAVFQNKPAIYDSYSISIEIPEDFPFHLPIVKEIGGKIPASLDNHINYDGSICLGSPINLMRQIYSSPTLNTFAKKCITPYLYAMSYRSKYGGDLLFGELSHGVLGLLEDYKEIFNVKSEEAVFRTLDILASKKREANKKICPCGCNRKSSKCNFRKTLAEFRDMTSRKYYKHQYDELKLSYRYDKPITR